MLRDNYVSPISYFWRSLIRGNHSGRVKRAREHEAFKIRSRCRRSRRELATQLPVKFVTSYSWPISRNYTTNFSFLRKLVPLPVFDKSIVATWYFSIMRIIDASSRCWSAKQIARNTHEMREFGNDAMTTKRELSRIDRECRETHWSRIMNKLIFRDNRSLVVRFGTLYAHLCVRCFWDGCENSKRLWFSRDYGCSTRTDQPLVRDWRMAEKARHIMCLISYNYAANISIFQTSRVVICFDEFIEAITWCFHHWCSSTLRLMNSNINSVIYAKLGYSETKSYDETRNNGGHWSRKCRLTH